MRLTQHRLALLLAASLAALVGCPNDAGEGSAPTSAAHSGQLDANGQEILRIQLELAAAEPTPKKRLKIISAALNEVEKGRLPASWTETVLVAGKASAPVAAKIMWKTLIGKDDMDPLVAAACKRGQMGLENIERVFEEIQRKKQKNPNAATFADLIFQHCHVKEMGLLDEVGNAHHGALAFAAVAFKHLSTAYGISDVEKKALRFFVHTFSEFFQAKKIILRPGKRRPAPSSSAAPSASPSGSAASSAAPTTSARTDP
jgi:hypothetical protein